MNRTRSTSLGVLLLALSYSCTEGTTALDTSTTTPSPAFSWQASLPAPNTITITITEDPNNPQPQEPGDYTFIANVTGGSAPYVYRWFWRGCNVNMEEEWCPDEGYWLSDQTGSSFTTYLGSYDTRLDVVVEIQQDPEVYTAGSGHNHYFVPGPLYGFVGTVHGTPWSCLLGHWPLRREEMNPYTGQPEDVFYRHNPCNGTVEYPY